MNSYAPIFAFAIYFLALFLIALISKLRSHDSSDPILGNRSLNFWVTAISAHASDMSSWLFLAFPVSLYSGGVAQCWIAISLVVGMFLNWHCIAPRLRTRTEALGASTISSFFAKRFPERGAAIQIIASLAGIYFLTCYLAAGMIGVGVVFESLFGIDYLFGLVFATAVVLGYTFIGGCISVAWADLAQGLFLLGIILTVPIAALIKVGGLSSVAIKLAETNLSLNLFGDAVSWKEIVFPFFAWGLGYFGMPHIITKFMAIKNPAELSKSKYVGISWQILSLGGSALCGIVAVAFFNEPLANPETLFIEMSKELFSPIVLGFAMCGIVAATISTMDSQILVAASMASNDLIPSFQNRASKISPLALFRICVALITIAALVLASGKNSTIMEAVYYSWSGLGSSFGPLMISSLYSTRVTASGAFWSIIVGAASSAAWPSMNLYLSKMGIIDHIPSMIPAFFLSLATLWTISLWSPKK